MDEERSTNSRILVEVVSVERKKQKRVEEYFERQVWLACQVIDPLSEVVIVDINPFVEQILSEQSIVV